MYTIDSYTDFAVGRHYANYCFLFQNIHYNFSYCFDLINKDDIQKMAKQTNWEIKNIIENKSIRSDLYKNMFIREKIYVLTKK